MHKSDGLAFGNPLCPLHNKYSKARSNVSFSIHLSRLSSTIISWKWWGSKRWIFGSKMGRMTAPWINSASRQRQMKRRFKGKRIKWKAIPKVMMLINSFHWVFKGLLGVNFCRLTVVSSCKIFPLWCQRPLPVPSWTTNNAPKWLCGQFWIRFGAT